MSELFGRQWTRTDLLQRVGDISQLGGARLVTLSEGPESGVHVAEVRTGPPTTRPKVTHGSADSAVV
jgi:hypothetical protein